MSFVSSLCVAAAALFTLILPGCDGTDGADDQNQKDEPMGLSSDALISGTSCKTTRMTAYDHGKPYPIDVIEIGNKRVSMATGHALLKMQKAADAAGVSLSISSGFRTQEEQQYFYGCYQKG